jgi:hypothetical protein
MQAFVELRTLDREICLDRLREAPVSGNHAYFAALKKEIDTGGRASEQAEMDACEGRVQAELALLRAENATVYARPMPWVVKS